MGFSLNPFTAIKILIENKRYSKEDAADYLESIAEAANSLAEIWQNVVESVLKNGGYNVPDHIIDNLLMSKIHMCNAYPYRRLEEHYKQVSSVLGRKYNGELNSIIFHIGKILEKRNLTKDLIINELASIKRAKIFNSENTLADFNSLNQSIDGLYKEAAALHVRAKMFRSTH